MGMRAAVICLVVLALAQAAAAQVTVKGDAQGWQDIVTAQSRLAQAGTYRVRISVPGGGAMLMEFVLPDRLRIVIGTPPNATEVIAVGGRTVGRTGQGPWRCNVPAPRTPAAPDARQAQGEVTVTRLGEATIDGTRTRAYRVLMVVGGESSRTNQYVAADSGLPRRVEMLDGADRVEGTMDYHDIGAPITIDLPACQ